MEKHETTDAVIIEALRLQEEGKTEAEIYARFPKDRAELEGIFSTITFLSENRDALPHEHNVLREAVEKATVTPEALERYGKGRGVPGRPSIYDTETLTSIMNKWRVMIPVGVVALLLIIFTAANMGSRDMSLTLQQEADQATLDAIDGSLSIESATQKAIDENTEVTTDESIDFAQFEQEMKQESKSVELGNEFESFFAEEQAMDGEIANTPNS
jgi:hypothetical protein